MTGNDFEQAHQESKGLRVYMVRSGQNGPRWPDHKCDLPVFTNHRLMLGELIFHQAHRAPNDPVWRLDSIGM